MKEIDKKTARNFINSSLSNKYLYFNYNTKFKNLVKDAYKLELDGNILYIHSHLNSFIYGKYEAKLDCIIDKVNNDYKLLMDMKEKNVYFRKLKDNQFKETSCLSMDMHGSKVKVKTIINEIKKNLNDNDIAIISLKSFETKEDLDILRELSIDNEKKKNFKLVYRKPFFGKYKYKIVCMTKYYMSKQRRKEWLLENMDNLVSVTGDEKESNDHKYSNQAYSKYKTKYKNNENIQESFTFYVSDEVHLNMALMTFGDDLEYKVEVTTIE